MRDRPAPRSIDRHSVLAINSGDDKKVHDTLGNGDQKDELGQ